MSRSITGRQLITFGILCVVTGTLWAQSNIAGSRRGDYERALMFFHLIQKDLRANDVNGLSKIVHYPLRTTIQGKETQIHSPQQFKKDFALIFTPNTQSVLLSCTDSDLWWRWDGYTVGAGIVWFDALMPAGKKFPPVNSPNFWSSGKMQIITVNGAPEFLKDCKR